jgi:predicted nucleotidyltransferase
MADSNDDLGLLPLCKWPEVAEPYAGALREAVEFVLSRTQPIGVFACGSILRAEADPGSDWDLYIIHREAYRFRLQKRFRGVPAEIFVNSPDSARNYMREEQGDGRPITAHMLATGFVVLDRDPAIAQLRAEAAEHLRAGPKVSPERLLTQRYLAADCLDNARDVLGRDPACATLILTGAVRAMLECWFPSEGRFIPSPKRMLSEARAHAPELGGLLDRFFAATDAPARLALAEEIADRTIGERTFFEWESERLGP